MAKVPAFAKAFAARWRIVEMDVWATPATNSPFTCQRGLLLQQPARER